MRSYTGVERLAAVLAGAALLAVPATGLGQTRAGGGKLFSTASWCADSGTACWNDGGRKYLNGVRIVADVDLSFLVQKGSNRFEGNLKGIPKIALEWNLVGGWVSLQTALVMPGTIQLDEKSPALRELNEAQKAARTVHVTWGRMLGLSFLDGSLSAGFGRLFYDRRDFATKDSTASGHLFSDQFRYVALQPISSIRSNLKSKKEGESSP